MSKPLPVIVGVAQFNARAAGMAESLEPLEMMMRVAHGAAEDCGQPDILNSIDSIAVVNIISWGYQNAPAALAEKLGIKPASLVYTSVGGNTPQYLVNHFAEEIAAGKVRTALIAGAEAMHTLRRLMKERRLNWGKI